MRNLEKYETFDDFIEKYKNYNDKMKYFKIKINGEIEINNPSYILEAGYMYFDGYKDYYKLLEFEKIYLKKEKKIFRKSNLEEKILIERFFRTLFNRDYTHCISLAYELLKRNEIKFFEIMYLNAKLSIDNNRLIKIYLFEKIYNNKGLILPLLSNLINYFTNSEEGYSENKEYDKLTSYIYEKKFKKNDILKIEKFYTKENEIIYNYLEGV